MCKTRKFVMAILDGKQGLLCDKSFDSRQPAQAAWVDTFLAHSLNPYLQSELHIDLLLYPDTFMFLEKKKSLQNFVR